MNMATPPRHPGMIPGANPYMYDTRAWMRQTAPPPNHAVPRPRFLPAAPVSFMPQVITSNSRPSAMPALLPQAGLPVPGTNFSGVENRQTFISGLSPHAEPLSLTNKDADQPLDLTVPAKRKIEDDQPLDLSKGLRSSSQPRRKMVATVKPEVTTTKVSNMTNFSAMNLDIVSGRVSVGSDCEVVGNSSVHPSSTYSLIGDHPVSDILYLFCTKCHSSYGSIHGFRKHFRSAHGFTPSSDDVLIQGIKATKEYFAQQPNASGASSSGAGPSSSTTMPRFHCISCGWQCDQQAVGAIKQHKAAHTDNITTFTCYYCKEWFGRQARLMEHLSLKHTENYQFICSFCKIAFAVGDQLSMHLQAEHGMFLTRPQAMAPTLKTELSGAATTPNTTQARSDRPPSHPSSSSTNSPGSLRKESRTANSASNFNNNAPTLAGINLMSFLDKVVETGLRTSAAEDAATAMSKVMNQKAVSSCEGEQELTFKGHSESSESIRLPQVHTSSSQSMPSSTVSQPLTMMEKLEIAITRELLADVSVAKASHQRTEALYTTTKPIASQVKVEPKDGGEKTHSLEGTSQKFEGEQNYTEDNVDKLDSHKELRKEEPVTDTVSTVDDRNNSNPVDDDEDDKDGPLQIVEESPSPIPVIDNPTDHKSNESGVVKNQNSSTRYPV